MHIRRIGAAAAIIAAMAALSSGPAYAASASQQVADAVNHPARPAADRERDADRKPAELIGLTGLHPGAKIAEIMPGGGYFTRIFSRFVGDQGVVYALAPFPAANAAPGGRDPTAAVRQLASDPNYRNVKVVDLDSAAPLPEPVDLVWTSLNYHDLQNRQNADLAAMNRRMFNALKPGGLYMVIDHAAAKGSGSRDTSTLHRIDPELVKQQVMAAGFRLVQESDLLMHSGDDRTKRAHEVERGKTDQFALLFQKPGDTAAPDGRSGTR